MLTPPATAAGTAIATNIAGTAAYGSGWVIVSGDLTGDPVDDEFDLLRDPGGSAPPERRPAWLLVGGLVAVVLLVLVGVVWMVSSVSGRGGTVTAGATTPATTAATTPATTTSAPAVTAAPTTTPAATTAAPRRTTTAARPTFSLPPVATAAPSPTPRRTPAPTTSRPVPRPTLPTPVGTLVPGVIGLRVNVATRVLRAQGFKVQVLGGVLGPDRDDRRVTGQRPGAGAVVPAGSTVILVTDGL